MWLLITRAPRQDAAYWPGRRWLALLDAVVWPMLWAAAVIKAPFKTGLVGAVAVALLVAIAASRSRKAVFRNERYWFTTWRWGLTLAAFATLGAAIRVLAQAI